MTAVARASVSADGVLLSADNDVLDLQHAAGGDLGGPLLLPALARVARLSLRLGQPIERAVVLGDVASDISAHARVFPTGDIARVELIDWQKREVVALDAAPPAPLPQRVVPPGMVRWASDVRLRLVHVDADPAWGLGETRWLGRSLAELFHLLPDRHGALPLLVALSRQADMRQQPVSLAAGPAAGALLSLDAKAMWEDEQFVGFTGAAAPVGFGQLPADVSAPSAAAAPLGAGGGTDLLGQLDARSFALRIDGALRRPLGRIIANAETIAGQREGPVRSEYAGYASDIALAGRHLLDLVDDLADLQAVDREGFTTAREPVDLADLARRAAGLLAMKAEDRGQRIDPPHANETAPAIGEFRRVLQILLNLIGNAIRYAPENSAIWLRVEADKANARVTVADQGPGIPLEQQDRLFEKFERLGRTDAAGSGLGLYISRRLARAMGGELTVDSGAGQGARFTLTLPRAPTSG